ncbi:vacuolar protein 8 [Gossypium australe]|uniref:Vacuolar protein 8 n=1 Tax=Gossypium australe TaxID=47621 RepID=A0A5B6X5B4_9ROSI|nr:vacuolar protein 8 [Gossypium australe]
MGNLGSCSENSMTFNDDNNDDEGGEVWNFTHLSRDERLLKKLVPMVVDKAKEVKGFPDRWKMIISKLE